MKHTESAHSGGRRAVHYLTRVSAVLLSALLTGCSTPPPTQPPDLAPATSVQPDIPAPPAPGTRIEPPPENTTTPATTGNENQPPGTKVIQWIIDFGPLGPKGVRTDDRRPFAALAAGDCERVLKRTGKLPEPTRSLYEGAASACLAAFHHQPDRWPRAYEALAVVRPHLPRLDCLDRAVYQLLDSMTELHRQYPDAVLTKDSDEQQGGKLSCPRIVRLVPDHGPRQGGYPVRVVGVNLPPTVGIHFGDHYITVDTEHGMQAVVTARGCTGRRCDPW